MYVQYRLLECGDWVLDFGGTWFRKSIHGLITKRYASDGVVKTIEAEPGDQQYVTARIAGYIAASKRITKNGNPYQARTESAKWWRCGWNDYQHECTERQKATACD
jgi:hypothetical protein